MHTCPTMAGSQKSEAAVKGRRRPAAVTVLGTVRGVNGRGNETVAVMLPPLVPPHRHGVPVVDGSSGAESVEGAAPRRTTHPSVVCGADPPPPHRPTHRHARRGRAVERPPPPTARSRQGDRCWHTPLAGGESVRGGGQRTAAARVARAAVGRGRGLPAWRSRRTQRGGECPHNLLPVTCAPRG